MLDSYINISKDKSLFCQSITHNADKYHLPDLAAIKFAISLKK